MTAGRGRNHNPAQSFHDGNANFSAKDSYFHLGLWLPIRSVHAPSRRKLVPIVEQVTDKLLDDQAVEVESIDYLGANPYEQRKILRSTSQEGFYVSSSVSQNASHTWCLLHVAGTRLSTLLLRRHHHPESSMSSASPARRSSQLVTTPAIQTPHRQPLRPHETANCWRHCIRFVRPLVHAQIQGRASVQITVRRHDTPYVSM